MWPCLSKTKPEPWACCAWPLPPKGDAWPAEVTVISTTPFAVRLTMSATDKPVVAAAGSAVAPTVTWRTVVLPEPRAA